MHIQRAINLHAQIRSTSNRVCDNNKFILMAVSVVCIYDCILGVPMLSFLKNYLRMFYLLD